MLILQPIPVRSHFHVLAAQNSFLGTELTTNPQRNATLCRRDLHDCRAGCGTHQPQDQQPATRSRDRRALRRLRDHSHLARPRRRAQWTLSLNFLNRLCRRHHGLSCLRNKRPWNLALWGINGVCSTFTWLALLRRGRCPEVAIRAISTFFLHGCERREDDPRRLIQLFRVSTTEP
jgi:hypothetical protein